MNFTETTPFWLLFIFFFSIFTRKSCSSDLLFKTFNSSFLHQIWQNLHANDDRTSNYNPVWSFLTDWHHIDYGVAPVRWRGDRPPSGTVSIWQTWGDKEFLSLISGKENESRHLVFGSLGTLTSLKDRARGLVA